MGMNDAIDGGLDFNAEIHETLREVLGEWSAQQFFSATATQSTTPELFVRAANRAFPERSLHVIFDMIAQRKSSPLPIRETPDSKGSCESCTMRLEEERKASLRALCTTKEPKTILMNSWATAPTESGPEPL
jgi:hypothetical protein